MPRTLLDATTSATESNPVRVKGAVAGAGSMPAHFTAPGLAGAETGTLQKQNVDGTWSDYYLDGSLQQITATHSGVTAYAPGIYRIDKSATAAAVPVEVSTNNYP